MRRGARGRNICKRDSVSPWATEARARLEELARPTPAAAWAAIEGRLQQSIDAVYRRRRGAHANHRSAQLHREQLLVELGERGPGGDGGARRARSRARDGRRRCCASPAMRCTPMRSPRSIAPALERLRRSAAREAHRDYAAAAALFNDDRFAAAAPGFASAQSALRQQPVRRAGGAASGRHRLRQRPRRRRPQRSCSGTLATAQLARVTHTPPDASTWFLGLIAFAQGRFGDAQIALRRHARRIRRAWVTSSRPAPRTTCWPACTTIWATPPASGNIALIAFEALSVSRSPRFKYSSSCDSRRPRFESTVPRRRWRSRTRRSRWPREWRREAAIAEILAQRASILAAAGSTREMRDADLREAGEHLAAGAGPGVPQPSSRWPLLATESDLSASRQSGGGGGRRDTGDSDRSAAPRSAAARAIAPAAGARPISRGAGPSEARVALERRASRPSTRSAQRSTD